jgi:hypothetical protein
MTYLASLVYDPYKGMFVKHPSFWAVEHPYCLWAQFIHDDELFRGVRY